ncbi:hypothetical protein [Erwinia phyllosphaerae]|uniref:hypothetical protein n=1 Tax=Erwinia phyllosphaerae TaxID=2853256 RepID=UPI001FEF8F48|nr:hypothetical protein [Erwinia phyllosphaerae]MBV4369230.1 hypothetical protein [Erwinia phyllosphaerae]
MKMIAFLFFLAVTLYCVWRGNVSYGKKSLTGAGKGLIGVFVAIIALGFFLKLLVAIIPGFTKGTARNLMEETSASFIVVWGMRFLITAISTIFSGIMGFHKEHNFENYKKFSPVTNRLAPGLLLFAKCVVSFGAVLMLYGVWFTS